MAPSYVEVIKAEFGQKLSAEHLNSIWINEKLAISFTAFL